MAKFLIDQDLIDVPYVKEQTDLPLLVLSGTKRFLRESDLKNGGKEDIFYFWSTNKTRQFFRSGPMGSDQNTIQLNGADPALAGTFQVQLADGKSAEVTTVFELLKNELTQYTLDKVAARTGLPVREIELFAKELGTRKPAMIIHGAGTNHWFHNDLINRSFILLVALTGNIGKNGGGFNHYVGQERIWPEQGFFKLSFPRKPARSSVSRTPHYGATFTPPAKIRTSTTASPSSGTSRNRSRTDGCRCGPRMVKNHAPSLCGGRTT